MHNSKKSSIFATEIEDGAAGGAHGGDYRSASPNGSNYAYSLGFGSLGAGLGYYNRYDGQAVRLVQDL